MSLFSRPEKKLRLPTAAEALPGRSTPLAVPATHFVHGRPMQAPVAADQRAVLVGMGCFWGAEKAFWSIPGVVVTAVGYAGGLTPNPTYREVCTGMTGHNEVVRLVFAPAVVPFGALLKVFWEGHDPTQGMRQGNDVGTQYRSGIYVADAALRAEAEASRVAFGRALAAAGLGAITTEILDQPPFYFAEVEHQQYLAKNPNGYCGLGGTGVACPVGLGLGAD